MMTRGGEGGKKCRKFDDVICERPLIKTYSKTSHYDYGATKYES